jgi:hypothetical protein
MTPRVIASRSSATFLPEKSRLRAAEAADCPAPRAPFSAFCWRARALPPALAARLRAALLVEDELERLLEDRPLAERLLEERPPDDLLVDRREPVEDEERLPLDALPPVRPLELELELLRPLEELLRDDEDPPPLPLFDSAISILLKARVGASGWAPHYFMPAAAVT